MKKDIELRSDTFTKPTKEMLEAMFSARVGDDVFQEDETVNALETKAADMFGMEAALFCASGTMTNQIAIRTHCSPGSEVITEENSHVYFYEGGGIAVNAQSSIKTISGDKGKISAHQVEAAINNLDDVHRPLSRLVSLENTTNRGGGGIYDFREIRNIRKVCNENNLKLHLDGARLFNALVETEKGPKDYGMVFDSISICLSKGLGCPVGSLLISNKEFIKQAHRYRKVMGGGWRQAGYLAAAGIYALENNIQRLKEDHQRAQQIGELFVSKDYVQEVYPIESNIVIFKTKESYPAPELVNTLANKGVKCFAMSDLMVRMVTHLDFGDEDLGRLENLIEHIT